MSNTSKHKISHPGKAGIPQFCDFSFDFCAHNPPVPGLCFMQNKANFLYFWPKNNDLPQKTNPIQTQTKPIYFGVVPTHRDEAGFAKRPAVQSQIPFLCKTNPIFLHVKINVNLFFRRTNDYSLTTGDYKTNPNEPN
jgi:hypothetical protein